MLNTFDVHITDDFSLVLPCLALSNSHVLSVARNCLQDVFIFVFLLLTVVVNSSHFQITTSLYYCNYWFIWFYSDWANKQAFFRFFFEVVWISVFSFIWHLFGYEPFCAFHESSLCFFRRHWFRCDRKHIPSISCDLKHYRIRLFGSRIRFTRFIIRMKMCSTIINTACKHTNSHIMHRHNIYVFKKRANWNDG